MAQSSEEKRRPKADEWKDAPKDAHWLRAIQSLDMPYINGILDFLEQKKKK